MKGYLKQANITTASAQGELYADLSDAVSATVNELRESFAIQHLLEANARFGTRYTEIILGHFGVQSPDARLQRPEYIGGGYSNLQMAPPEQIMKLQAEAKNLNASANLSDVRSTLVDIETGLLALDEQAFKLLSQKLGLPA